MVRRRSLLALGVVLVATACSDDGDAAASRAAPPPTPPAVVQASPVTATTPVDVADRTLARIGLSGGPDFLAASGGLLWVKFEDPILQGLDPATGAVRRRVQVAPNPAGQNGNCKGLGGDAQHLWSCAGDGVGLVAAAQSQVVPVAGVKKISDQTALPVQDGRVWVIEPDGTTVTGLRVADGKDPVRLPLGHRCVDVVAGAGTYLWLACPTDGVGLRLDAATGDVVQVPGLRDVRAVAAADAVFFSYRMGLARVDQETAEVTGAVAVGGGPVGLYADGESVWVRDTGTFLRRLDAMTLALQEEIRAPEEGGGSVLLAYDALWASDYDNGALYRLKPRA